MTTYGLPTPQCLCYPRDAPHKVAVPSGPQRTQEDVFDAWNGYHSVPLHPDDTHCTTFITPWGRYRYLTAPQGYKASGDGYTARFDGIVEGISSAWMTPSYGLRTSLRCGQLALPLWHQWYHSLSREVRVRPGHGTIRWL
jgi:hypothetical protein